jgi:uncharacterized coiled-coil protein SlyX
MNSEEMCEALRLKNTELIEALRTKEVGIQNAATTINNLNNEVWNQRRTIELLHGDLTALQGELRKLRGENQ